MAHLNGTLDTFARAMFGADLAHPAAPVVLPLHRAVAPRSTCWFPETASGGAGWVEWGGCGMVNPNVLRACGDRPRRVLGLRLRHGHRAHPAVPQRLARHARHRRGRRPVQPRPSGSEQSETCASPVLARPSTSTCPRARPADAARRRRSCASAWRSRRSTARRRVTGPLVVGRVLEIEELTGFKKPIRWCQVDAGEPGAARHRLRRPQLRRRRPRRRRAARRRAARWLRDRRAQDLRPRLRRDDLLGARAGPRRRPRRDPRARRAAASRRRGDRRRRRCSAWTTSSSSSPSPPTAATACPCAASPASSARALAPPCRPGRRLTPPAGRRRRLAGRRVADRGRLRPLRRARGRGRRPRPRPSPWWMQRRLRAGRACAPSRWPSTSPTT